MYVFVLAVFAKYNKRKQNGTKDNEKQRLGRNAFFYAIDGRRVAKKSDLIGYAGWKKTDGRSMLIIVRKNEHLLCLCYTVYTRLG